MKPKKAALSGITNQGMLPLFFHEDADVSIDIVRALYKGGVEILEYTNRGKQALDNFKQIKKVVRKEMPDLLLGAGTIKNVSEAEAFIDAGADFIVSPIVNPEVAHVVSKHKLLWVPGCMTPTEIYLAQKYGADLIKLFPANILGVEFLSSIRDLFPGQLFIPTGGVELTSTSIGAWFKAGVCAVGMGSKLITNEILKNKKYDQLQAQTEKALTLVKAAGGLK
jgi:2-dehydro-3-deoxyphosphogluconate aldolase/(4S)-4-hydroxy-2-oxoglutarate aldolase